MNHNCNKQSFILHFNVFFQVKKLVRDKIPEIIRKDNRNPITHIASNQEYSKLLKDKLLEEVKEFIKEDNEEELSDILEVIEALIVNKKFNMNKLLLIKNNKRKINGGFRDKIVLDKILNKRL